MDLWDIEMLHDHAESLLEKIHTAFRDVPLPPDHELAASDRYWGEVESFFDPPWRTWAEVPPDILMANWDVLVFLSPIAFRFYLPAFMAAALRDPDCFLHLVESARYAIPPWDQREKDGTNLYEEKVAGFSREQLDAAIRFAEYFDRQLEPNP